MKNNGFTLIEALFAILLVGLAIASLVGANAAFTRANGAGADLSTAEFLLEQVKELTATLDYDDLDDFDGEPFSPPISADGTPLTDFGAFTQEITVAKVSASNFEPVDPNDSTPTPFIRVTARVLMNSTEITSASWIRADY
ncbi:MAG: type II secretion system protein [Phycisphaerae bacterium]|nr:type II secretion system protein [Phycisphaerae bacterium]